MKDRYKSRKVGGRTFLNRNEDYPNVPDSQPQPAGLSINALVGIYRSHMCHLFSFSGSLHRRDPCPWPAPTTPCSLYLANCHSFSQLQQDDSSAWEAFRHSRPSHCGSATPSTCAHLEACVPGASLYTCVCVCVCVRARARMHAHGRWACVLALLVSSKVSGRRNPR